jgi:hypothetical protein
VYEQLLKYQVQQYSNKNTCTNTDAGSCKNILHNVTALSAEGHPYTELVHTLTDTISNNAVKSHTGQNQRKDRKDAG